MFLADPDLAADEATLLAAADVAKAAGSVTLLNCEDGAMLRQAGEKLIGEGPGAVANFPDARPVAAKVAAVDQAIGIAPRTGARVYIVHLSSAAALDRCRWVRAARLPVYVETRPLYLHLTRERSAEPDADKYVRARRCATGPTARRRGRDWPLATSTRCAATMRRGRWTSSSAPRSTW
jgi:dihydroorotase-like cyclic amidohydrolase